MATSPEAPELLEIVPATVPHGVIEIKGAWRAASGNGAHVVADALVRCIIHALEWLGAEVALAAVAERLEALASLTGARKVGTESATYPSERYRTILMAWHRSDFGPPDQAGPGHAHPRGDASSCGRPPIRVDDAGWRPVVLDARHADRPPDRGQPAGRSGHRRGRCGRPPAGRAASSCCPPPTTDLLEDADRHVYYPWRHTVVRMVGPGRLPGACGSTATATGSPARSRTACARNGWAWSD